jgi:hypothetical protein
MAWFGASAGAKANLTRPMRTAVASFLNPGGMDECQQIEMIADHGEISSRFRMKFHGFMGETMVIKRLD